jgi:hypothetical protein
MAITLRGIYHNINESDYFIENNDLRFYFSSIFYLDKFLNEYKEEREKTIVRLKRIYEVDPNINPLLSDITLYKNIEKRGYRIEYKGEKIKWLEIHKFVLVNQIKKSINDWQRIHEQN